MQAERRPTLNPVQLLWRTIQAWHTRQIARLAGSLAYYAASSLLAMLLLLAAAASAVYQYENVRSDIVSGLQGMLSSETAQLVSNTLSAAMEDVRQSAPITTIGMLVALLYVTTRTFRRLQGAINIVWEIEDEKLGDGAVPTALDGNGEGGGDGPVLGFLRSLLTALALGSFILLILLANGAAFAAISTLDVMLPEMNGVLVYQITGIALLVLVLTGIFAFIFRFVPDRRLPWGSILLGAALTAVLFSAGQFILRFYVDIANPATGFGIAGVFVILLLWVYFDAQIILFGAVFIHLHVQARESV
ncbi:MAG: YihY/virulence factor BrkB family protein [Chloroflexi bacterium]|nr:YihY/virulence factor BrkB family protein [Chloroflexota bacterium]